MKKFATSLLFLTLGVAAPAVAQLRLTITQGVTDPIPIAIVPFGRAVPADGAVDVAAIVQRDLESSGRFKGMPRTDMLTTPTTAAEVEAAAWKQMRSEERRVGKEGRCRRPRYHQRRRGDSRPERFGRVDRRTVQGE